MSVRRVAGPVLATVLVMGLGTGRAAAGEGARPAGAGNRVPGVVAWGSNTSGQLGDGSLAGRDVPAGVTGLAGVVSVASGDRTVLALLRDGTVMAWGDDAFGQLGNGIVSENGDSEVPAPVAGLPGVVAVAAGQEHSLALLANGTVRAWGDNAEGQLGDGTRTSSGVPVPVQGLSGVRAIAAGGLFSLALLDDGTVMAWGDNADGQLGDGSLRGSDVPVAVTGLAGPAVAITAGWRHAVAVLRSGTVMAWGDESHGELGTGIRRGQSTRAVRVPGIRKPRVAAAAPSGAYTLALMPGGTVMSFGTDSGGFFGSSYTGAATTIPGLAGVTAIAPGGGFGLAVVAGGAVDSWGSNEWGQLGTGNTAGPPDGPDGQITTVKGLTGVTAVAAGAESAVALTPGPAAGGHGGTGPFSTPWRVTPSMINPVTPDGLVSTDLEAVTSASPHDAWAVGASDSPGTSPQPLAEHWNGSRWHKVPVPLPAGVSEAELSSVTELSPRNVWAVGNTGNPGTATGLIRVLIEHWNGTAWSVIPGHDPATGPGDTDSLTAVGGTSPSDLWAAGFYHSNSQAINASILEHWNGSTWTLYPDVFPGAFPTGIITISGNDAWVSAGQLVLHWDGHGWTQVTVPVPTSGGPASVSWLYGITAAGPGSLWAIGTISNYDHEYYYRPYALHWNGTAWSLAMLPFTGNPKVNPSQAGSALFGITAISATDIWAVGATSNSDLLALTEHYNGTTWDMVPSLHPGDSNGLVRDPLTAITHSAAHDLLTIGTESLTAGCCSYAFAEQDTHG